MVRMISSRPRLLGRKAHSYRRWAKVPGRAAPGQTTSADLAEGFLVRCTVSTLVELTDQANSLSVDRSWVSVAMGRDGTLRSMRTLTTPAPILLLNLCMVAHILTQQDTERIQCLSSTHMEPLPVPTVVTDDNHRPLSLRHNSSNRRLRPRFLHQSCQVQSSSPLLFSLMTTPFLRVSHLSARKNGPWLQLQLQRTQRRNSCMTLSFLAEHFRRKVFAWQS